MNIEIITIDAKTTCPECKHHWKEVMPMTVGGDIENKIVRRYLARRWFWIGPVISATAAAVFVWWAK